MSDEQVQQFPDEPQPKPAAPPRRLVVAHETITLELADKPWVFRTLSFMDATIVQPHMIVLANLLTKTEPVPTAAEGMVAFRALLEQVNPILAHDDALLNITQPFFMAVVNFYFNKHDWGRMVELAAVSARRRDSGGDDIPQHLVYLMVCAKAAETQGMKALEFMDARFEYAVDVIMAMHERYEMAKREEGYQRPDALAATFASLFGETQVTEENAPEWVKAMLGEPRDGRHQKN